MTVPKWKALQVLLVRRVRRMHTAKRRVNIYQIFTSFSRIILWTIQVVDVGCKAANNGVKL